MQIASWAAGEVSEPRNQKQEDRHGGMRNPGSALRRQLLRIAIAATTSNHNVKSISLLRESMCSKLKMDKTRAHFCSISEQIFSKQVMEGNRIEDEKRPILAHTRFGDNTRPRISHTPRRRVCCWRTGVWKG